MKPHTTRIARAARLGVDPGTVPTEEQEACSNTVHAVACMRTRSPFTVTATQTASVHSITEPELNAPQDVPRTCRAASMPRECRSRYVAQRPRRWPRSRSRYWRVDPLC